MMACDRSMFYFSAQAQISTHYCCQTSSTQDMNGKLINIWNWSRIFFLEKKNTKNFVTRFRYESKSFCLKLSLDTNDNWKSRRKSFHASSSIENGLSALYWVWALVVPVVPAFATFFFYKLFSTIFANMYSIPYDMWRNACVSEQEFLSSLWITDYWCVICFILLLYVIIYVFFFIPQRLTKCFSLKTNQR